MRPLHTRLPFQRAARSFARGREGVASIEMAIVFPLLALLMIGLMQVGFYQFGHHGAQSAADKAARQVIVMDRPTTAEVLSEVNAILPKPVVGTYGTPRVTETTKHGETFVRIEIDYAYRMALPFISPVDFNTTAASEARLRDMP